MCEMFREAFKTVAAKQLAFKTEGLKKEDLNGKEATMLGFEAASGRFMVRFTGEKSALKIKASNLSFLQASDVQFKQILTREEILKRAADGHLRRGRPEEGDLVRIKNLK